MRKTLLYLPFLLIASMLLFSCKKETDGPRVPATPASPGNPSMNAVPLTGGNILGRWSSEIYYTEYYLNDSLVSTDLDSVQVGEEIIEFSGGGNFNLYMDTTLFETGNYTVSSNTLDLTMTSGDDLHCKFGVSNNKMRWRNTEIYGDTLGVHKIIGDLLFVRY